VRKGHAGPCAEEHAVPAQILQGLKEIGDYLGLQHVVDERHLVLSWISREGLPAKRLGGRWCAEVNELEAWWAGAADSLSKSRGQS